MTLPLSQVDSASYSVKDEAQPHIANIIGRRVNFAVCFMVAPRFQMVPDTGFEPVTCRLSDATEYKPAALPLS